MLYVGVVDGVEIEVVDSIGGVIHRLDEWGVLEAQLLAESGHQYNLKRVRLWHRGCMYEGFQLQPGTTHGPPGCVLNKRLVDETHNPYGIGCIN